MEWKHSANVLSLPKTYKITLLLRPSGICIRLVCGFALTSPGLYLHSHARNFIPPMLCPYFPSDSHILLEASWFSWTKKVFFSLSFFFDGTSRYEINDCTSALYIFYLFIYSWVSVVIWRNGLNVLYILILLSMSIMFMFSCNLFRGKKYIL